MNQQNVNDHLATNTSWNNCHIDIWFDIAKYLRPEDTLVFALICKKTLAVTNSESFWRSIFNRYIRSKYQWLDVPTNSTGFNIRDQTIRELFRSYPTFSRRKRDPDSYDKSINKICLNITHSYDEKLQVRYYHFKLMSKKINVGRLAQQNQDEGCQLLLVTTKHFVPVPYESENLVIKSITKTLSRGFRFYKLTIQFCDQFSNRAGESIVFDPIINVQLYDWWDSRFDKILNHKC